MEICASDNSQPQIAKILTDKGAEIYRIPGAIIGNPLCTAVRQGHEAIAGKGFWSH